jgi:hypothetical protein
VVQELRDGGIPDHHLHAVASAAVPMEGLPQATILEKSEFKYGLETGISVGGAAGLLGGLLAVTFPPAGLALGGGAILAMTLAGAGFGAVVSGLVAKDIPNHELEAFEAGIIRGKVLLLVDVPKSELEKWRAVILEHHPDAEISVTDRPKGNQT